MKWSPDSVVAKPGSNDRKRSSVPFKRRLFAALAEYGGLLDWMDSRDPDLYSVAEEGRYFGIERVIWIGPVGPVLPMNVIPDLLSGRNLTLTVLEATAPETIIRVVDQSGLGGEVGLSQPFNGKSTFGACLLQSSPKDPMDLPVPFSSWLYQVDGCEATGRFLEFCRGRFSCL